MSSEESPIVALYRKPTWLGLARSSVINLVLPFLNGVFLGFGEIFAHEVAFLLGWRGANVKPGHRMVGPGVKLESQRLGGMTQDLEQVNRKDGHYVLPGLE
ncbi:hypothetical protein PYCC9005_001572 [Savitreella phatthalungensis]